MNISSLVSNAAELYRAQQSLNQNANQQASQSSSRNEAAANGATARSIREAGAAFQRAEEGLAQQNQSAQVKLSGFGQLRSAVAEVRDTATALSQVKSTANVADARKTAQSFVDAYNREQQAAQSLTQRSEPGAGRSERRSEGVSRSNPGEGNVNGVSATAATNVSDTTKPGNTSSTGTTTAPIKNTAGALEDDGRVRRTANESRREVSASQDALRQAGITVQRDGSLKLDSQAFDAAFTKDAEAVTRTLNDTGRSAAATASRQLSRSGTVGGAIESLNNQVDKLQSRQNDLQARFASSQQAVEDRVRQQRLSADPFTGGAAAYLRVFSG